MSDSVTWIENMFEDSRAESTKKHFYNFFHSFSQFRTFLSIFKCIFIDAVIILMCTFNKLSLIKSLILIYQIV